MDFLGDLPQLHNPNSTVPDGETLPLEGILRSYIQEGHKDLRVAFPAAVTGIEGDQTVDVQPLLQTRYTGSSPSTLPQIRGVPVIMPRGATFRISYPLSIGDTGLVIVADRSLDGWLAGTGGVTDPNDTRCHHLADAIFVPGLVPDGRQTTDTGRDLVLACGAATLRLQPSGKLKVNNTSMELLSVLHDATQSLIDTLTALQSIVVVTSTGPASLSPSSVAQFQNLQATVTKTLAALDTFKG